MNKKGSPKKQETAQLGIPAVLRLIPLEKLTAVLPVRLTPSLAQFIRSQPQGASAWIREAIMMRLTKETG